MAYDFDKIACTYDRLNRVMTLGLDRRWRRLGARAASPANQCGRAARTPRVLDVACGTGDMAVSLAKRGCTVTGIDLSEEMLEIAKRKFTHSSPLATLGSPSPNIGEEPDGSSWCVSRSSPETGEGDRHEVVVEEYDLRVADAEHLPFPDDTFDAVTCAFGVRNFVHLEQGISEMLRVLKPGGRLVILELATPDCAIIKPFYNLYTKHIIPWLGKKIAGNREAYTYLPESIERFPKGDAFLQIIRNSEFRIQNCSHRRLTFGVCRLYTAQKQRGHRADNLYAY